MNWLERSTKIAVESDVAVQVLLNPDATDIEFWPLQPRQAVPTGPEEFCRRQLRSVGVVGLRGVHPRWAFKEPLTDSVVGNIAQAFLGYVSVLIADGFSEPSAPHDDFVPFAEELWSLEDTRSEL